MGLKRLNPPNPLKYLNREKKEKEYQTRSENYLVGKNVERIIKAIFDENGIDAEPTHKGADLIISWPEDNEGCDVGPIEIERYLMEIKFTSSSRAHLSFEQGRLAGVKGDKYLVTVVENGSQLREELLKYNFKEKSIPEEIIKRVIHNSSVIQNIKPKLGISPDPSVVEWDLKGYWIKKKLWTGKKNISNWITEVYL